ncbi:MAG: carboxymuconolactone decarboxylase family protein [Solirubrobacterales bacterium]
MDLYADQSGGLMKAVANSTHAALASISGGKEESLTALAGTREQQLSAAGLDPRTFALVKIAAMIALDAPPASYAREIGDAVQDFVTPEDLLGVLRAVAPQVGGPRVVAAAPELMLALGLSLPESTD